MPMQQIMRRGHDFLRIREGECLTLIHEGKSVCQKETPKNIWSFPHAFTFSSSLTLWGLVEHFDHPSLNIFSFSFPHGACTFHHRDFTQNPGG